MVCGSRAVIIYFCGIWCSCTIRRKCSTNISSSLSNETIFICCCRIHKCVIINLWQFSIDDYLCCNRRCRIYFISNKPCVQKWQRAALFCCAWRKWRKIQRCSMLSNILHKATGNKVDIMIIGKKSDSCAIACVCYREWRIVRREGCVLIEEGIIE